jgi:hypothetical protein
MLGLLACSRHEPASAPKASLEQAATAAPTLTTINIDGQFNDWQLVLLNPLQVTNDGNSISGAGCYPTNSDRDCEAFTPQRDITQFAWTYDTNNIYTMLQRPTSQATLTYSFVMDVNADGFATAVDRVLQVTWKTGNPNVNVKLFAYAPFNPGGDPLACPNAASCPSALNPHAAVGFVDGYTMPGTTGAQLWTPPAPVPACGGSAAGDECGGDGVGTRFEVYVPWSQLGVPQGSPIYWHVSSSTNAQFNQAKDNVGGPDGMLGTFGVFGVDFTPDRTGFSLSPGTVDYCHTVLNTGNFHDTYNLKGVSTLGASVSLYVDTGGCTAGALMAVDANGDGSFTGPGDSVTPAWDTNGDGQPDTGSVNAGATFKVLIRVGFPAGLDGASGQMVATATSITRPALVFDTVTDRTSVGPVALIPNLSLTATPGATVSFGPHTVRNQQPVTDTFRWSITSSHGYAVALYSDQGGAPGMLLATDSNGDGVWDGPAPTTGPLASGATIQNWIRVTVPPGAAIGTIDLLTPTVTSVSVPSRKGSASDSLKVLSGLTLAPSYAAPSNQIIGAAGGIVYLPHVAINSLATNNVVTLSQTGTLAAGYTLRWLTDPNGDGNPSDGVPITGPFTLAPNGGSLNFVTEIDIPVSGTPSSTLAATTGNGSSATTSTVQDNVAVGNLDTYADPLFLLSSRAFAACSTLYAKAVGLTPLQTTNYQLRITNPAATVVSNNNLPTDSVGTGSGTYTLGPNDAPGSWRVSVYSGGTLIYDLNPVLVERSGTVLVSGPPSAVPGQPLVVTASLTNTQPHTDDLATQAQFVVKDPSNNVLLTATVPAIDVASGATVAAVGAWPNVSYPAAGNYSVTVTWTTSCGSTIATGSTTIPYPPGAPTLTAPADGAYVTTASPALTGTALAGATVNVYVDGALVGTSSGPSFSLAPTVSQGTHSWYATQTVNGVTGPPSATFTFIVDSIAPSAPLVSTPADGSLTNDATPLYSGTAEAGATVRVSVDGALTCTTTAGAGGAFSCAQPSTLPDGSHTVNATATDAAGNTSPVSNTNTFTIDTVAPFAPTVTAPAAGSATNNTQPAISGFAELSTTVTVVIDGAPVCSGVANGAGAFSCVPALPLSEGMHSVTASATDAALNTSPSSAPVSFTVDLTPPNAPVVTAPATGTVTANTTPMYVGTAEPGSTVQVSVDGLLRCTTVAGVGGAFGCAQPTALGGGVHTVNATATDAAGNTSPPSNTNSFTVDSTVPAAPLINTPPNGSFIATATPLYSGTADPNVTVKVSVDGALSCTVVSSGAGAFSCPQPTALSQGPHAVNATATNAAMTVSPPSNTNTFTVDTVPPNAPAVTAPTQGSVLSVALPTYSGTAEANSVVQVRVDGADVCIATTSAGGTFTCAQPTALTDGPHAVTATAADAAGNLSPPSAPVSFTVDTLAPAAPVVTSPADQSFINNPKPTYSGTAEPNSTVRVSVDGALACTVAASAGGNFSCPQPTDLGEGPHQVNATATDAAGNASGVSATLTFTVDLTAPAVPVVTSPGAGSVTANPLPVYAGTAEALSTVQVFVDGVAACSAVASAAGTFGCAQVVPLAEGPHGVTAVATDAAGNPSASSAPVVFVVDRTPPAAPSVTVPPDSSVLSNPQPTYAGLAEPLSRVTVSVDGAMACAALADATGAFNCPQPVALLDGTHAVSAVATDAAGNTSATSATVHFTVDTLAPAPPLLVAPANGSILNNNRPTYSGSAEPGATVHVTVNGAPACTAVAAAGGAFNCTQTTTLPDGLYTIQATATDAAGNTSAVSNALSLTIETQPPLAPTVLVPADGSVIGNALPSYSGRAEANSTVNVSVDGAVACTTVASSTGTFLCAQPTPLTESSHAVTATATDIAGNVSPVSATVTFTVDLTAPAAPTLTSPMNGALLNVATPTLGGTAEASSTVTVKVDGATVCTATASASGAFSCVPTTPLADGAHQATATAKDAAGNTSATSAPVSFSIDATPPDTTITSKPPAQTHASSADFTFTSNESGATFECSLDGASFTACPASATFVGLSGGSHTLDVRAKDAAGNVDPTPAEWTWTVLAPIDTTIVSGPMALSASADATFSFSSTVTGAQYECSLDGSAFTACANPVTFSANPDGAHSLRVRAKDPATGELDATPARWAWVVDTLPPQPPVITDPTDGATVGFTQPRIAGVAEPLSTVSVIIDGMVAGTAVADATGAWSFSPTSALASGPHTVSATAKDAAGNTSPPSLTVHFTVDTSTLDTRITSGPPSLSGSASAQFGFESNNASATFECSLDGAAFATCSNPAMFSALTDGTHALAVRARAGGQVDPTPATWTWRVDTTAPTAPVITAPADGTTIGTATPDVRGTAEPQSTVAVTIDGQPVGTAVTDASGAWLLTVPSPLASGAHTASAVATDAAGNASAPSADTHFTVDLTALDTFILSGPPALTRFDSAAFVLASNVTPVTYECRLDSAAFAACGDSPTFTSLTAGAHHFEARAKNAAGNVDATPASWDWSVDVTLPAAPLVVAPANGAVLLDNRPGVKGTADPNVTVRISIDGALAGWATSDSGGGWTVPPVAPLTDGMHTVFAVAVDAAGNMSAPSNTNTFRVLTAKLAAPVITSPANGALLKDARPTISGTAPANASVTVLVDGAALTPVAAGGTGAFTTQPPQPLIDGAHVLTATASDGVRTSATSAPVMITIDTAAPDTQILSAPDAQVTADVADFQLGSNESPVTYECSLDNAAFSACGASVHLMSITVGSHTFAARATDAAGNTDATPATATWQRTAPVAMPHNEALIGGGCSCGTTDPGAALLLAVTAWMLRRRRARR